MFQTGPKLAKEFVPQKYILYLAGGCTQKLRYRSVLCALSACPSKFNSVFQPVFASYLG
jgi:hypothetical protein